MNIIYDNRGNIVITVLAVFFGVALGLLVCGRFGPAEAVIGDIGNVTASNNPHNLSAGSLGINAVSETRVCVFCHTPHNAIMDSSLINAPLWNHNLSSASYTLKTAGIYNQGSPVGIYNMLSSPSSPDGASKMCLGCHDGTIGVGEVKSENYYIAMDTSHSCLDSQGKMVVSGGCPQTIGTDLTTKHVISIPINDTLITDSINNCCFAGQTTYIDYPWNASPTRADTVILRPTNKQYSGTYGVSSGLPSNGKYGSGYRYGVQCSTCHDPHYWADVTDQQTSGHKFLVIGFNNLCNACHQSCGCP